MKSEPIQFKAISRLMIRDRVTIAKFKEDPEKAVAEIEKQDLKISNFRTTVTDKVEGKDVSLTTSKIKSVLRALRCSASFSHNSHLQLH